MMNIEREIMGNKKNSTKRNSVNKKINEKSIKEKAKISKKANKMTQSKNSKKEPNVTKKGKMGPKGRKKSVDTNKTTVSTIIIGIIIILLGIAGLAFIFRFSFMPAAVINGKIITEAEVCDAANKVRINDKAESDEEFASFMRGNTLTPETFRDGLIDRIIEDKIFEAMCDTYNVTVSDEEINNIYKMYRDNFYEQYSEQGITFEQALSTQGTNETSYKEAIKVTILSEKIILAAADAGECDEFANQYYKSIDSEENINNTRMFYILTFLSEEEASSSKERLLNNNITIEDLSAEITEQDSSHNINADIEELCIKDNTPKEYYDIIRNMSKDEIVILRDNSADCWYLIYTKDIITCNEPFTSLEEINDAQLKDKMVKACVVGNGDCLSYLINNRKEHSEIIKYDMPWGLPYDIDVNLGK